MSGKDGGEGSPTSLSFFKQVDSGQRRHNMCLAKMVVRVHRPVFLFSM